MQAAGCGTEIDDDVDESFAGVVCTFDELLFVEILAPLNDVDSKNKIYAKMNEKKASVFAHLSFSSRANSKPSSRKLATVSSIRLRDSFV